MEKHVVCKKCGTKLIVCEVNSMPGCREEETAYCINCKTEIMKGFISGSFAVYYDTDNENILDVQ